jgi:hypothetical protein
MTESRKRWQEPQVLQTSVHDVLSFDDQQAKTLGPPGLVSAGLLITGSETLPRDLHAGPRIPFPMTGDGSPSRRLSGPPVPASDVRLKEDIAVVGSTVHGLPLYAFRYRGQPGLYEGVMAQDVIEVRPDAVVIGSDGFYRVDYARLGIECRLIG